MIKDNSNHYGLLSILLHWLIALSCFGLFALGWWMVQLDYYNTWYTRAPHIHKSIGLLLLGLFILSLAWKALNPAIKPIASLTAFEQRSSKMAHWLMRLLLLFTLISGYLISTANGRGIDIFDWLTVPATLTSLPQQESLAGEIHFYLAYGLCALALLHALAALKHHFFDRDNTLRRMLGRRL